MPNRIKRTYNLPTQTVTQVRELVGQYGTASQDAVVELAVERLFRAAMDQADTERWAEAAADTEFQAEMGAIATAYRDT